MTGVWVLVALAASILAALYLREWIGGPSLRSRYWWARASRMWLRAYEAGQEGDTERALWLSQRAANLEDRADPDWEALP